MRKRVIALILSVIVIIGFLTACSTLVGDDKGAIINMYLTDEIYNYDPAVGFYDAAKAKLTSLMFEGLTVLDEDGNWKKGMMDSYKVITKEEDKDGEFKLQVTLRDSSWSDGRTVQANDFVYAWKRILSSDFESDAAPLLYNIKNAKEVKAGDASIDDLGVVSSDTYVLEITFVDTIDVDEFFTTVASPALVPLREDVVTAVDSNGLTGNWAKKSSSMVTNGAFDVKRIEYGTELRLERTSYYKLSQDDDSTESLDKYVIPYRLVIHYGYGDLDVQLDKLLSGDIFYLGEIPLDQRETYASQANLSDTLSTLTYYFNTNNKLFSDSRVRQALSMAIDREGLVNTIIYGKAATGLIPTKAYNTDKGTSFREVADANGALINTTADVSGAEALLKEAGVTKGSFEITCREREEDMAVANYVKSAWESLGFTVKVNAIAAEVNDVDSYRYDDGYLDAFSSGDFDVISIDLQMLSPYAFGTLATFATDYSGNGVNYDSTSGGEDTYEMIGNITGYNSDEYNQLIDQAYEIVNDSEARAEILHQAETLLMTDMPVIPLIFMQDAYLYSNELSGISSTYFATRSFSRVKEKNYMQYKEEETQVNEDIGDGE